MRSDVVSKLGLKALNGGCNSAFEPIIAMLKRLPDLERNITGIFFRKCSTADFLAVLQVRDWAVPGLCLGSTAAWGGVGRCGAVLGVLVMCVDGAGVMWGCCDMWYWYSGARIWGIWGMWGIWGL